MRNSVFILFIGIIFSLTSCRKDFDTVQSTGNLEFSKQTVYLDTVFTNIGSSTYMLKVYNRSKDDIVIPTIKLGRDNSKYRIMVDGMTGNGGTGKVFSNVELLAKDSLFIFIETTASVADVNPADFLYTDEIQFFAGSNYQKVDLVTLIQDAVFLYPTKENGIKEELLLAVDENGNKLVVEGFELNEADPVNGNELHWTKEKPYVIYGYAGVPNGKNLVIDAGARIHFHATSGDVTSGIAVLPNGQININGEASPNPENPQENEVIFEGDRLEPMYSDIPGQWGTIWLLGTNRDNTIKHATIKNAIIGLQVQQSKVKIENSQLYDHSNFGILAINADITGTNLVLNTAGQANFAAIEGGKYSFKHCTFNNNWASSNQVSVWLTNYSQIDADTFKYNALSQADFFNCIIYGSNRIQLFLDKASSNPNQPESNTTPFNYNFNHCLVKFNEEGINLPNPDLYATLRTVPASPTAPGNYIEMNPKFQNIVRNKLNISEESPAVGKANTDPLYFLNNDILGNLRSRQEIGAYAASTFPN